MLSLAKKIAEAAQTQREQLPREGLYFLMHEVVRSSSSGESGDADVLRGPFPPASPDLPKDRSGAADSEMGDWGPSYYEWDDKVLKQCTAASIAEARWKLGVGREVRHRENRDAAF